MTFHSRYAEILEEFTIIIHKHDPAGIASPDVTEYEHEALQILAQFDNAMYYYDTSWSELIQKHATNIVKDVFDQFFKDVQAVKNYNFEDLTKKLFTAFQSKLFEEKGWELGDDHLDDDQDNWESFTIEVEPEEPECPNGEHEWCSPHEVVGGIKENPGVQGNGGGVIVQEVCSHCGCLKTTNTWAQNPETGEQGLTSVEYDDGDREYRDAWEEWKNE